ncbi:MAG: AAA family ATPase [Bacillota bacterium]|jgi:AAA15 family ATPase/GTPase|nr:AAA family ATPase [Bacillota bacterium]
MKILRVKFDNIIIFDEPFDIDFTAQDRILENSGVYNIWGAISTQQIMSIVGINASGKTTSLKLLNLALEIVLNNKRLNEGIIPSVFLNEKTEKTGVIMTVYFYKEDRIFELESKIRYRTNFDGEMHFYYEYEILRNKAKSTVKSKRDIFDFSKNVGFKETKRDKMPKESLKVLKDEDSIVITETKDSGITINTMFEDFRDKINYIQGKIDKNILNVFDENIKRLERIGKDKDFRVEFKNSQAKIKSHIIPLEEIVSSGTIRGQKIIKNAVVALKSGGYLIIDELESHLNKELVKMIINLFNNKEINKNGACLIFTTHYAEILDSFDRMDNIYILTRSENYFTKIHRYSKMVKRSELKKSEVILSNYIKGSAPKALNITNLEEYICENL